MDCNIVDTRRVEVIISKGELLEMVAKKMGRLPPIGYHIYFDTYSSNCGSSLWDLRTPTFNLTVSWKESIG